MIKDHNWYRVCEKMIHETAVMNDEAIELQMKAMTNLWNASYDWHLRSEWIMMRELYKTHKTELQPIVRFEDEWWHDITGLNVQPQPRVTM